MALSQVVMRVTSLVAALSVFAGTTSSGLLVIGQETADAIRKLPWPVAEYSVAPVKVPAKSYRHDNGRYRGWWTRDMLQTRAAIRAMEAADRGDLVACTSIIANFQSGGENPGGGPPPGGGGPPSGSGGGNGGPSGGGGGPSAGGGMGGSTNPATGNLLSTLPLVSWPCKGDTGVGLTLYHNSQNSQDLGVLGRGWKHSYEMSIAESGNLAIVEFANGLEAPFEVLSTQNGETTYKHPKGFYYSLTKKADGTWEMLSKQLRLYKFNSSKNLVEIKDRWNNKVTITRDSQQRVTEVYGDDVSGSRRKLVFTNGSLGLENVTVANGNGQAFFFNMNSDELDDIQFDSNGQLGIYRGFLYDSDHRIVEEWDWDERVHSWGYDTQDRIIYSENALGKQTTHDYSTDAQGHKIVEIGIPGGQTTQFTYDNELLIQSTDAAGYQTNYTYDAERNMTQASVQTSGGSNPTWRTVSLTYDNRGNPLNVTDPNNKVTTFTWRNDNQIDSVLSTAPQSMELDFIYHTTDNWLWQIKRKTAPSTWQVTDSFQRNAQGEITEHWDALNRHTKLVYDSLNYGDVTQVQLPAEEDAAGNRINNPVDVNFTYLLGRVATASVNGNLKVTNTFDHWMRVWDSKNAQDKHVTALFDSKGNPTWARDELNRISTWVYDDAGRLTKFSNAKGEETNFGYDDNSWLTSTTNARGYTTTYEYTDRGEVKKMIQPQSLGVNIIEQWTYNPDGSVASAINPLGTTTFDYDVRGLLTGINYPNDPDVTFAYDELGRTTSMQRAGESATTWQYNAIGLVDQMVSPQGTIQYEYDLTDALTKIRDVQSSATLDTVYEYGAGTGRLRKVHSPLGEITQFNYDSQGRVSQKDIPGDLREEYTYDTLDRVADITLRDVPANAVRQQQVYSYYDDSNVLSVAQSGTAVPTETTSYTYDAIGQLLSETKSTGYSASYTYDANGNRLSKSVTGGSAETYSYDWGDKLLDIKVNGSASKTFAYDNFGRTTGITASGATTTFSWNDTSRLTSINLPNTTADPAYSYNAAGTRVSRTLTGSNETWKRAGVGVTAPVMSDSSASYVPGISERRGSTTTYSHHGIKNELAQSSGSFVSGSRSYDAFGAVLASNGTWQGQHGYAGGFGYQEDAESGLKLLGHRYYDSSTGRFLSRDPIKDGRNWYGYCYGNPVSLADPNGKLPVFLIGLIIGAMMCTAEPAWAPGPTTICELTDEQQSNRLRFVGMGAAAGGVVVTGASLLAQAGSATITSLATGSGTAIANKAVELANTPIDDAASGNGGVYGFWNIMKKCMDYIGRTNDFDRRGGEHAATYPSSTHIMMKLEIIDCPIMQRVREQMLIEKYGLENLDNKINSIAKSNPLYEFTKFR